MAARTARAAAVSLLLLAASSGRQLLDEDYVVEEGSLKKLHVCQHLPSSESSEEGDDGIDSGGSDFDEELKDALKGELSSADYADPADPDHGWTSAKVANGRNFRGGRKIGANFLPKRRGQSEERGRKSDRVTFVSPEGLTNKAAILDGDFNYGN